MSEPTREEVEAVMANWEAWVRGDHDAQVTGMPILVARIKELEGALKPFADFADTVEKFVSDRAADGGSPIMPTNNFRLSDFRAARRALAAAEKPNA